MNLLGKTNIKYLGVSLKFVSICYTQSSINKDLNFWGYHSSIILPSHTDIINSTLNHLNNE